MTNSLSYAPVDSELVLEDVQVVSDIEFFAKRIFAKKMHTVGLASKDGKINTYFCDYSS